ncbi:MAG: UDP-N-acetylmuramate dehydrogenase [Lachnospiraceae bacterium]|nr:UDP-N-acetylmuramate dehydrogenase [Lachnospiraceae bacterium]
MNNIFYEQLKEIVGELNVKTDEPMKGHITFKVGGPADYYILPENSKQLAHIVKLCKKNDVPYYIIGNGSNLIVKDEGYRGVIIEIGANMAEIEVEDNVVTAGAGAILSKIAAKALDNSLTGMEFAHGIPGTLGGAVTMNAGAYGGEMKDILVKVQVLNDDGEVITLPAEELHLGYRYSVVPEKRYIVLSATMKLEHGDKEEIKSYMAELSLKRREKQPLEYPSAGSTFKRPEGYFAGKLIQDAGLKGYSVGGAMVSEKHSGFVINYDNATAQDILTLIDNVREKVYEQFGVELETEVKVL